MGKKRLLILAGAGASVEFGMPSVSSLDTILSCAASKYFMLSSDSKKNLYQYISEVLANYWKNNRTPVSGSQPNFEDILLTIMSLEALYPAGIFTGPIGAFVDIKNIPEVDHFGHRKAAGPAIFSHLVSFTVDTLLEEFRSRCVRPVPNLTQLENFFNVLSDKFDVSIITTNYDGLIHRCVPKNNTGFRSDGSFDPEILFSRENWSCTLQLHGSVHFNMEIEAHDLHAIHWKDDLAGPFAPNSSGRSQNPSSGGIMFPTSVIVAGGSKSEQILRQPFRSYYSEMDRVIQESEALLICGFGFADMHITQAFSGYWGKKNNPTVVIDYADDGEMLAGSGFGGPSTTTAERVARMAGVMPGKLISRGFSFPDTVDKLKIAKDFQRCREPGQRLSLWYNGMLEACRCVDKFVYELS